MIAFEAPFYACLNADATVADSSATFTMRQCLGDGSRNEELRPLFDYMRRQRRSGSPLYATGIDVRTPDAHGVTHRPAFLRSIVARVDTSDAAEVFRLTQWLSLTL